MSEKNTRKRAEKDSLCDICERAIQRRRNFYSDDSKTLAINIKACRKCEEYCEEYKRLFPHIQILECEEYKIGKYLEFFEKDLKKEIENKERKQFNMYKTLAKPFEITPEQLEDFPSVPKKNKKKS